MEAAKTWDEQISNKRQKIAESLRQKLQKVEADLAKAEEQRIAERISQRFGQGGHPIAE